MRLTLRKRIVIAVAAIAAIHGGFYYVPKYVDERPRFYPQAYAEAVEVLKGEVGAEAVEKGIFSIPRREVSCRRRVGVEIRRQGYWRGSWRDAEGRTALFLDGTIVLDGRPPVVVQVGRKKARHILATLVYLGLVGARGRGAGETHPVSQCTMELLEQTHRPSAAAAAWSRKEDKSLGGHAAAFSAIRRLDGILRRGETLPLSDEGKIASVATDALKSAMPPRSRFDERLAAMSVELLAEYPSRRALGILEETRRIGERRRTGGGWQEAMAKLPIVGRIFSEGSAGSYDIPFAHEAISKARVLGDKTREWRVKAAAAALRGKGDGDEDFREYYGEWYLCVNAPDELTRFTIENWNTLSSERRTANIRRAVARGIRNDVMSQLGAEDSDARVRFWANYWAYGVTGDRTRLLKCTGGLPAWNEVRTPLDRYDFDWRFEYLALADAYAKEPTLSEIPAFFRRVWKDLSVTEKRAASLENVPIGQCFRTLMLEGGEENAEIIKEIVEAFPPGSYGPVNEPFAGEYYQASYLDAYNHGVLNVSRDPYLSDMMIKWLEGHVKELGSEACLFFVNALAENGDERVLPLLDGELALVREGRDTWRSWEGHGTKQPYLNWLSRSIALVHLLNAGDILAHVTSLGREERELVAREAAAALAKEAPAEGLLGMLADEKYESERGLIYLALIERREMDRKGGEGATP